MSLSCFFCSWSCFLALVPDRLEQSSASHIWNGVALARVALRSGRFVIATGCSGSLGSDLVHALAGCPFFPHLKHSLSHPKLLVIILLPVHDYLCRSGQRNCPWEVSSLFFGFVVYLSKSSRATAWTVYPLDSCRCP